MRAVILAGGKGRRLHPYTTVIPKPLMPVGDRPILEIILSRLKEHGVSRVTMAEGYLAELVEAYFRDGKKYGVPVDYSVEEKPLGTIGGLSLIDGLQETFFVMNGDVLTNLDYQELVDFHSKQKALATIATYHKEVKIDLGILEVGHDFRVKGYKEKPSLTHSVSMGIYVFEPEVLRFVTPNEYLDFPDLILSLLEVDEKVVAFPFEGFWLDIGRHEDYVQAQEQFEMLKGDLGLG
jgi:NDP-sugar pyrophosphorylase family protein